MPLLLVTGFGAHRVLARECGLHVLELADGNGSASRATARVRLAVAPLGDVPAAKLPRALIEAFDKAPRPTRGGAALSRRAGAAGAQRRRQLAHRQARRRAARRFRSPGGGGSLACQSPATAAL